MNTREAIKIYDSAHKTPTSGSVLLLIRATQLLAKNYRQMELDGLTRDVADRFDEWKHTKRGRRIISEIGVKHACSVFTAGGCWSRPEADPPN